MYPKINSVVIRLVVLLVLVASSAAQSGPKLRISGTGITTMDFSAADLSQLPRLSVDVQNSHNGQTERYEGVRVSDRPARRWVTNCAVAP
jgi:hypothetical protein